METMIFMRGDGAEYGFAIPADNWSAGGRLFFAAKEVIDDDTTDAQALIKTDWNDTTGVVTDVVINGVNYKQYTCGFDASATQNIVSQGAESLDLLGEYEFVPPGGGNPVTFPAPGDSRIPVTVYFDVNRRVSV